METKQPTQEQIKEFWEWCGVFWEKDGVRFVPLLPIDLNNLFLYTKDKFRSMACGSLNEDKWKGAWAKVITHKGKTASIQEEGVDPALALFWAIWEVKDELEN